MKMGRTVCFHCGEHYDEARPVCPHCGAERDFTYAEEPTELKGWGEQDDAAYREFLESEGLAPRPSNRPSKTALVWGILLTVAISGLILLLL